MLERLAETMSLGIHARLHPCPEGGLFPVLENVHSLVTFPRAIIGGSLLGERVRAWKRLRHKQNNP